MAIERWCVYHVSLYSLFIFRFCSFLPSSASSSSSLLDSQQRLKGKKSQNGSKENDFGCNFSSRSFQYNCDRYGKEGGEVSSTPCSGEKRGKRDGLRGEGEKWKWKRDEANMSLIHFIRYKYRWDWILYFVSFITFLHRLQEEEKKLEVHRERWREWNDIYRWYLSDEIAIHGMKKKKKKRNCDWSWWWWVSSSRSWNWEEEEE